MKTLNHLLFSIILVFIFGCNGSKEQIDKTSTSTNSTYLFERGFPANEETIQKAQYATDLRRAIEAYKFFFPTVATEAVMQQFQPHGAIPNKVGIIMPQDPEQQFSVANQDTPYIIATLNLKESGPIVVEIPEGPYLGILDDHNMDWIADMGLIGPGKGKGEKNLILPPGYKGQLIEGYHASHSETWEVVLGIRLMSMTGSYDEALTMAQKVKIYSLNDSNESSLKIINVKGQKAPLPMLSWEKNMNYWNQLAAIIDRETVLDKHRVMLGMLAPLGIKKGEPFNPSESQIAILEEAAKIGFSELNIAFFANPRPEKIVWEGLHWEWVPVSGPLNAQVNEFGTENYRDLLASDHYFFQAWGTSSAIGQRVVGAGSIYFAGLKDATGAYLDGGKNYKLIVPGPVPAKLFWSVTVYDSETRTIIDTGQGRGSVRSLFENPQANSDGSFDIYFGPDAPKGIENQWVKTVSGKGWFTFVRMYGPEKSLFDGSYKLQEIEEVK